jgi:hypothetical protein
MTPAPFCPPVDANPPTGGRAAAHYTSKCWRNSLRLHGNHHAAAVQALQTRRSPQMHVSHMRGIPADRPQHPRRFQESPGGSIGLSPSPARHAPYLYGLLLPCEQNESQTMSSYSCCRRLCCQATLARDQPLPGGCAERLPVHSEVLRLQGLSAVGFGGIVVCALGMPE